MTTETTAAPETTPTVAEFVPHAIEDALKFPFAKLVLRDKNIRSSIPDVSDMVASIKAEGIIEPLIAVQLEDGTAQLVAATAATTRPRSSSSSSCPCACFPPMRTAGTASRSSRTCSGRT